MLSRNIANSLEQWFSIRVLWEPVRGATVQPLQEAAMQPLKECLPPRPDSTSPAPSTSSRSMTGPRNDLCWKAQPPRWLLLCSRHHTAMGRQTQGCVFSVWLLPLVLLCSWSWWEEPQGTVSFKWHSSPWRSTSSSEGHTYPFRYRLPPEHCAPHTMLSGVPSSPLGDLFKGVMKCDKASTVKNTFIFKWGATKFQKNMEGCLES